MASPTTAATSDFDAYPNRLVNCHPAFFDPAAYQYGAAHEHVFTNFDRPADRDRPAHVHRTADLNPATERDRDSTWHAYPHWHSWNLTDP